MDRLHYEYIKCQRPVLILIHGFLGSMQQWAYLENELSNHYSLLKIDLPGHGNSPEFTSLYTLESLTLLIDHILIKEHIEKVAIVGHSMGGYLASAFAQARPEKVSSITLLNSIAGEDLKERKILRDRSINLIQKHQEAYINMAIGNLFSSKERELHYDRIKLMKEQAHSITIKSIVQALVCMRDRKNHITDLANSKIIVHYIYGTKDQIIVTNRIIEEAKNLNAKISKIDCGHMSLLTNDDDILKKMFFIE
ncbi:alpha/beta hydrolase [uncultured Nonlabens sp.]|uniref:alpha/beta hydrolase n=1 Tax=uncultured Nonlabens sp. TaxID=859306 RepID=UPI002601F52A|nr:alpha/beta hydrolase [uncultured Nonlabens sp.]